tara:strand:- start:1017 stop:1538 length:522 start_codon:yes stop_codon:yes gene_type:complete
MFGFGKKKQQKEMADKFNKLTEFVLSPYIMSRKLQASKMKESNLNDKESQVFEMAFLLGVVDAIGQYADPNGDFITPEVGLDLAKAWIVGLDIMSEPTVEAISSITIMASHHDVIVNLQVKGGTAAFACINSVVSGGDSSEAFKAMNLDYYQDADLIKEFKNLASNELSFLSA